MKKLLFGIAVLAIAVMSQAQRGGGGFGFGGQQNTAVGSIAREDVQEELKLTDDQKSKIADITDRQKMFPKMQEAMKEAGLSFEDMRSDEGRKKMGPIMQKMQEGIRKEIEAVLTPDQAKRWMEVTLQLAGNSAILREDIQKALKLSDDQVAKIKKLGDSQQQANAALGQKMFSQEITREELQEKVKKNNEILDAELGKILTDDQKAQLTQMGGKHFEKKDDGGL